MSDARGAGLRLPGPLVLASGSPRRHELLAAAGVEFVVRAADLDESPLAAERPLAYVGRLAMAKAEAVAADGEVVLAADTTVDVDGTILAKPLDEFDAVSMLRRLSGRRHEVHTAVAAVWRPAHGGEAFVRATATTSTVDVVELTDADIDWYVRTGEPADKAGAYAMQGSGARFVRRVDGSVSGVIGLPMAETMALLRCIGTP